MRSCSSLWGPVWEPPAGQLGRTHYCEGKEKAVMENFLKRQIEVDDTKLIHTWWSAAVMGWALCCVAPLCRETGPLLAKAGRGSLWSPSAQQDSAHGPAVPETKLPHPRFQSHWSLDLEAALRLDVVHCLPPHHLHHLPEALPLRINIQASLKWRLERRSNRSTTQWKLTS